MSIAYDHDAIRYLLEPLDGGGLLFRRTPEGFVVDEIGLFEPSGAGEHLFLRVKKRGLGTPFLVRRLREVYGLKEAEIGYAGQKDAQGVTSQWLSVPARAIPDDGAALAGAPFEGTSIEVLETRRHDKKLRLGMLKGNRFDIFVEGDLPALDVLSSRAETLAARGMPNYFGGQRFGFGGESLEQALRFFGRGKKPRTRRERFWISSIQSALFNRWLSDRVEDDLLFTAIDGDVLAFSDRGSNFECEDPQRETPRVAAGEVVPAGPMWGRKMRPSDREALTRESRSLRGLDLTVEDLMSHRCLQVGERRRSRVFPKGVSLRPEGEGLWVSMELPKGSYATVFLRELFGRELGDGASDARPERASEAAEKDVGAA